MKKLILTPFFILGFTLTQAQQIARIDRGTFEISQALHKVEVQEITMQPGQAAPKHLHGCPVVGVVKSGEVLFQLEGEEPQILKEGESFYEPKNATVLHFDNASKTKPLLLFT